jgi:predicted RNase H-like nuclease (RuvC/YqgF family)
MKEYLKIKFISKKMMINEIKRIDDVVGQLSQVIADHNIFLEELKKDNYKEKYREEHKKYKTLEKESQEIIETLTAELKKLERENRKLKREVQL